jgi:ABC-type sugar transport system substrate-binding protein
VANATKSLFGTDLIVVKAGPSAQDAQQAMDSIIAQKPSAVILPTVDPVSIRAQMEQLAKADIPVVALGVTNTEDFPGIEASIMGKQFSELAGKLFADWAVTTNGSAPSVF